MRNSDLVNVIKNSFYLYLIQGLNYLLPLLTLPYLIMTLSGEQFGKYSFSFATSQFFVLLVDFGFNLSATKKIAENSDNKLIIKDIYLNVTFIKSTLFLVSILLAVFSILIFDRIYFYREGILISFIMVLGTALFPVWWFQGLNKIRQLSIINIISKLLTYPLIFIFVKKTTDSNLAILFQSLTFLVSGIISICYIYKTHHFYFKRLKFISIQTYINEIKDSWSIFLSNSSISLYTNSLTLLLGFFSTTYNVGLFSAMERIVRVVCFGILGPVNQACFPVIAKLKISNFNQAKSLFKTILIIMFVLMGIAFIFVISFQNMIIDKFLKEYDNVNVLFNVFISMIFPISLGGILGQLGLLGLGGEKEKKIFSKIYIFVGTLSSPLSIFSIYYFNVKGAIYSMLIIEIIIFILMAYFVKKNNYL